MDSDQKVEEKQPVNIVRQRLKPKKKFDINNHLFTKMNRKQRRSFCRRAKMVCPTMTKEQNDKYQKILGVVKGWRKKIYK